ncbi:MAG: hypothetical protein ACRDV7_08690 [Acidimicrobiia bacterium]
MPTHRLWALLVACVIVSIGARVAVASPEACARPTATQARQSATLAAEWIITNQAANGTYTYAVDGNGDDLAGYNIVRHAGVTLAVYQAVRAANDDASHEALQEAGDRALEWMLDRLRTEDDWVALAEGNSVTLGASALMLAALTERRELTRDSRYDDEMRGLGNFLASMQRPNGDFYVSYDLGTDEPDRVSISQYYAGEAMWALARLHNTLPDDEYRRGAERAANFIATERDDRDFVPVAPLNDHWASYGFAEMAEWPITDAEAKYARALYARFQLLTRWEASKDAGVPYSWTHGPERRAAALGTWVEGQAALARLARTDDRLADLRDLTLDSTGCGAGVLVARQRESNDPRVAGAWFTDDESRMDDQQHAISGLLALADLLEQEPTS